MAKAPTSEKIVLKNVRLSFPQIWKPKAFAEGQEPKFQAAFLIDPANAEGKTLLGSLKAEMKRLAIEAFGEQIPKDLKFCVTSGDLKSYDGYKGMMVLSASNSTRPTICNRKLEPVAEGDDQAPYAGCYVNATITLWAQSNQWGKRINANLRAIQFVKDGEAFGRGPVEAEDEFEPLDDSPVGASANTLDDDIAF